MTYLSNTTFNPSQISVDAGGFLRVAQQTTLADLKILNHDKPEFWENAGTGTGTFISNKFSMDVASGQWYIKQTKRRYAYFSGKSQRVEQTFDGFGLSANVTKRVGYFSSNAISPFDSSYDGFWLENDGTSIVLKCSRLGAETLSVDITNWSGYSQLAEYQTLSTWDNFTVIEWKFLWLGGAVLVLSIKNSRGFVEAHRFNYAGTSSDTFISSPSQPVRYEIRSSTGTGSLRYVCSQVASEGSIEESGSGLSLFNATSITTNTIGTIYALIGVRKSITYRDNAILITGISVANTASTDAGILMLVINPTLSAALTYTANSEVEVAYATNQTITANTGRVIAAVPIANSAGGTDVMRNNFLGWLSSTLDDSRDQYILAYRPTTANQSVNGVINLKEF